LIVYFHFFFRKISKYQWTQWNNIIEKKLEFYKDLVGRSFNENYSVHSSSERESSFEALYNITKWTMTKHFLESFSLELLSDEEVNYTINFNVIKKWIPMKQGPYKKLSKNSPNNTTYTSNAIELWVSSSEPTWIVFIMNSFDLEIYLQLETIEPTWMSEELSKNEIKSPYLILMSQIKLKLENNFHGLNGYLNHAFCISDPYYEHIAYFVNPLTIYSIKCPWLFTLQNLIFQNLINFEKDISNTVNQPLLDLPSTQIQLIVDMTLNFDLEKTCSEKISSNQLIILTEPYLGYMLMSLTPVNLLTHMELTFEFSDIMPHFISQNLDQGILDYHNPLKEFSFEKSLTENPLMKSYPSISPVLFSIPKIVISSHSENWLKQKYPEFINENSLELFLSYVSKLSSNYIKNFLRLLREMTDR
jgi:hypothetical protein